MDSPLFVSSTRFPVPHGFSARPGGVSSGPFASLNLGWNSGDEPGRVRENFNRLAQLAGFSPEALHTTSQVHGVEAREVSGVSAEPLKPVGEADALWTDDPHSVVGVKTADCVPLLLAFPDVKAVAAIHSGWKGTLAGVTARTVDALVVRGASPERLAAAIGPCIRRCCYEVSPELADAFEARFGGGVVERKTSGSPHLDLPLAIRLTLEGRGVLPEAVDDVGLCTACHPERFYSHRRDRGITGRHLNFAVCRFQA